MAVVAPVLAAGGFNWWVALSTALPFLLIAGIIAGITSGMTPRWVMWFSLWSLGPFTAIAMVAYIGVLQGTLDGWQLVVGPLFYWPAAGIGLFGGAASLWVLIRMGPPSP